MKTNRDRKIDRLKAIGWAVLGMLCVVAACFQSIKMSNAAASENWDVVIYRALMFGGSLIGVVYCKGKVKR